MKRIPVWLAALLLAAVPAAAQEPAVIHGRVTSAPSTPPGDIYRRPEADVRISVRARDASLTADANLHATVQQPDASTTTAADGTYRLVIPADRIRLGDSITITVARTGLSPASRRVVLRQDLVQHFMLMRHGRRHEEDGYAPPAVPAPPASPPAPPRPRTP
jgi:hypothetical protein